MRGHGCRTGQRGELPRLSRGGKRAIGARSHGLLTPLQRLRRIGCDDAQAVLEGVHARIRDVNARILPRGVKLHPYYDRSHLMELTTHTVLENLLTGIALVTLILFQVFR